MANLSGVVQQLKKAHSKAQEEVKVGCGIGRAWRPDG